MAGTLQGPDRILVALSGGVDSAVAVRVLQQNGFAPQALVISFSPAHARAVEAAQLAAAELDVPLSVVHCEEQFDRLVVQPFCEAYTAGRTPNPCVGCNPGVKFDILAKTATERGIRYIASGHYARVEQQNGVWHVAKAMSEARDQSYMLYRLPQEILSRLVLPVGEFEKDDIRAMAQEFGLTSAQTPDSQEICFIPNGNYPAFIAGRGLAGKPGRFTAPDGTNLGPHKGVEHYTVGQRRGIGLALGKPVFVKTIQENGNILLGWAGEEFSSTIALTDIVTANGLPLCKEERYAVKIRSAAKPVPVQVAAASAHSATLRFDTPQRAAAPGQHAVLYTDALVIGGGIIHTAID